MSVGRSAARTLAAAARAAYYLFVNKVLIVTGGARGIGAATAKLAAMRGYAVCVNYRQNQAAAESVVAEIAGRRRERARGRRRRRVRGRCRAAVRDGRCRARAADRTGQQRRHPGAADARRPDRRRADRSRLRHQRARHVSLRARSGAADVDDVTAAPAARSSTSRRAPRSSARQASMSTTPRRRRRSRR